MSASEAIKINIDSWIEENKKFFVPPVCNKMMHNEGQMKIFYVGGPNQRKDYHIEEGEELFYMVKGDMCLKVVEGGVHKDIPIKEGEIFMLPGFIAHSPQRKADTIGLVIERERAETELDGLRYFVEKDGQPTLESLYEKWFHCIDLGSQLAPVIKGYFASEQHKTGKPIPGTIPENPPIKLDFKRKLEMPFSLNSWIEKNRQEIDKVGHKTIFGSNYQFQVYIYGQGTNDGICETAETLLWQLEGHSSVTVGDSVFDLGPQDNLLVKKGVKYFAQRPQGSLTLIGYQDPTRKAKVKSDD